MEIFIVLTVALSISMLIYLLADRYSDLRLFSGMLSLIFLIVLPIVSASLLQSSKTAEYLNKNYNTEYTTQDIFWNEKLIKSRLKIEDKIIDDSSKIKLELINK